MKIRSITLAALLASLFLNTAATHAVDLLYVTTGDQGIITFDTTGNDGTAISATKNSFANTQLNGPKGLAIDSLGYLFVANSGNGRVGRFDSTGGFLYAFPTNLPFLEGLALDSSGNVYVSDFVQNTISKFDPFGALISTITTNLNQPKGLAFDASGNLYAVNGGDNTISKFNATGAYVSSISTNLNLPSGVAINASGDIYASNNGSGNNFISKFDAAGGYLSDITTNLNNPEGLAIDSLGNLYVANYSSGRISKYDGSGNLLTSWHTGSLSPYYLTFNPVSVPEPSTYALGAIASGVLAYVARRRKGSKSC